MQVILLENIKNLGKIGDVVKVKRGYARNYLIKFEKKRGYQIFYYSIFKDLYIVSAIKKSSGVSISIISIFVYGTFMAAPASLGVLANVYGVNNIFLPMLLVFLILLIPIGIFKREFKL